RVVGAHPAQAAHATHRAAGDERRHQPPGFPGGRNGPGRPAAVGGLRHPVHPHGPAAQPVLRLRHARADPAGRPDPGQAAVFHRARTRRQRSPLRRRAFLLPGRARLPGRGFLAQGPGRNLPIHDPMTTSSASAKQHQGFAWRLPLLGSAALLAILVALIYSPGLSGDFVFDDFSNIVANKKIHAETLDFESLARAASAYQGPIGRPLATVGFAIDYAVGGKDPFAFKLHSLIVHLLNSLLVFLLCRHLLAHAPVMMAARTWMPLALGAAWALHPIQVSSVLY